MLGHLRERQLLNPSFPALSSVCSLIAPPAPYLEEPEARRAAERARKEAALNIIIAYCGIEEPPNSKMIDRKLALQSAELRRRTQQREAVPDQTHVGELDASEQLRQSVCVVQKGERIKRCFVCVGGALTLDPNDPNVSTLSRWFAGAREAGRHFRTFHLSQLSHLPPGTTECPI
ncbi:hypothetical protein LA080_011840 [Diaporthe eres]|nr:hypothetical protein LA080_011840 [Diaporthe eres]